MAGEAAAQDDTSAFETDDTATEGLFDAGEQDSKPEDKQDAQDDTSSEGKDAGSEQEGAPEAYEEFTLPEGMQVEEELMQSFQAEAKERGLNQAQAQAELDRLAKYDAARSEVQAKAWTEQVEGWTKASRDAGLLQGETLRHAQAGLKLADDGTFGAFMKSTGLDKHPTLIRVFAAYGAARVEDGIETRGNDSGAAERDPASVLYDAS